MIQQTRPTTLARQLATFFLRMRHHLRHGLRKGAKRTLDIVCGSLVVLMLSPLLITAALVIVMVDGRPVTFAGRRVGLLGRLFPMMKFRTMRRDAEAIEKKIQEHKISQTAQHFVDPDNESVLKLRKMLLKFSDAEKYPNDPRILPFGKFMRKFSVDELPQLFHIINGDMSLVGPRPFAMWEVAEFTPRDLLRHKIKPGLTGLWQVSARHEQEFDRWVELDLDYIDRWSLWLDLKILLKTIPAVLSSRGAS